MDYTLCHLKLGFQVLELHWIENHVEMKFVGIGIGITVRGSFIGSNAIL